MKIEIWSDIACPFCYIGKRHLEKALEIFSEKEHVEIIYRSFQLDPNAPKESRENIYQQLAEKYAMSIEQAKATTAQIAEKATAVGLDFHFATLKPVNTADAHRLLHFAKRFDLMPQMSERLFRAFFTESLNVAKHDVLIQLAVDVGLDAEQTAIMLNGNDYANEVEQDQRIARAYDISSVPFFLFNEKYAIAGAQPISVFTEALTNAKDAEKQAEKLNGANCSDGSCSV